MDLSQGDLTQDDPPGDYATGARLPLLQRWQRLPADKLVALLDRAGEERFLSRSRRFRADLAKESWDELCYRGIMEAMGYSRNRRQFLDLAQRLPWHTIRETATPLTTGDRGPAIQALLMRAAGLQSTPSSKGHQEISEAETPAAEANTGPGAPTITPMDPSSWCYAGARPVNWPHRRIAGAAALLARHMNEGLLAGFFTQAGGPRLSPLLDTPIVKGPKNTLIGRSRALDIAVNAVLSLLHSQARMEGDHAQSDACMRLYRNARRLADNEMTREMAVLLRLQTGPRGMGAARQQGLIHLYGLMLQNGDSAKARGLKIGESAAACYRYR